ncbi:MAG: hypothetical protein ACYSTS_19315 [Planctomycetota bacterium]|jgi:hypothetical protein
MWFGKYKAFKEANKASKKELSEEAKELNVQIRKGDEIHGQDTYNWPNGDKYVGEWKDGQKNGQGTYTWSNGNTYVGVWRDDKRNGHGTWTLADGLKREGEWKNDEMV